MPTETAYLVFDTESVPDGQLIAAVKYPGEGLTPDAAIDRYRDEIKELSWNNSDFIPHTFQIPVSVCVIRVANDHSLSAFTCLDAPHFRTPELVRGFWRGIDHYKRARLVTFNGRGFDLPMLELAAFRQGLPLGRYLAQSRHRYQGGVDLQEFFTNYGASRFPGGLNLAAKSLGLPGKMDTHGHEVLQLYRDGKLQQINDYCLCDTLDTYFVFLRTRVLTEDITIGEERELIARARTLLMEKADEQPVIAKYFETWDALKS